MKTAALASNDYPKGDELLFKLMSIQEFPLFASIVDANGGSPTASMNLMLFSVKMSHELPLLYQSLL